MRNMQWLQRWLPARSTAVDEVRYSIVEAPRSLRALVAVSLLWVVGILVMAFFRPLGPL